MYYAYALMDIRKNLPFYIGKGLILNMRHEDHFKETIDNTINKHKFYKIDFLRRNGIDIPVNIIVNDIVDEDEAYDIEEYYIGFYGRENIDEHGILTNICKNNRPPLWKGRKQSKEHIANRVASYINTCDTVGRPAMSQTQKDTISKNNTGIGNPFYGRTHTAEFSKEQSARMAGNEFYAKEYTFVSPVGTVYNIFNFSKFCRENKLTISTMEKSLVSARTPKYGKCAGWLVKKYKSVSSEDI